MIRLFIILVYLSTVQPECVYQDNVYNMAVTPLYGYGVAGFDPGNPCANVYGCESKNAVRLSIVFDVAEQKTSAGQRLKYTLMRLPGTAASSPHCIDESAEEQIKYAINYHNITDPQQAADAVSKQLNRPGWAVVTMLRSEELSTYFGDDGFADNNFCLIIFDSVVDGKQYSWEVVSGLLKKRV